MVWPLHSLTCCQSFAMLDWASPVMLAQTFLALTSFLHSFARKKKKFVIFVSRVSTNLYAHMLQVLIFSQSLVCSLCFSGATAVIPVVSANTHCARLAYTANAQPVCFERSLIFKSGFFSLFTKKLLFTSRSMSMYLRLQQMDYCFFYAEGFINQIHISSHRVLKKVADLIHPHSGRDLCLPPHGKQRVRLHEAPLFARQLQSEGCVFYLYNRVFSKCAMEHVCKIAALESKSRSLRVYLLDV